MMYPEPGKGGRGKKSAATNSLVSGGFSRQLLDHARTVLAHTPELAAQVLAGVPLAEAYSSRVAAQSGLEVRRAQRRGLAGPPPKSGVGVLAGALLDAAEGAGGVGIPHALQRVPGQPVDAQAGVDRQYPQRPRM